MSESLDSKGRSVSKKKAASRGMDDGWTVTGTLITGIAFWGFVGWGLTKWTGWVGFFPIGVILGAAAGVYLVYKQASAPPPLLDISKNQDGGLLARHARRLEQDKAERKGARTEPPATDSPRTGPFAGSGGEGGDGRITVEEGHDQGHTDSTKQ